ncbi:MAG: formyl-CoA transferase [Pelagibaca sp.]|nr:formyl-CoA transferase [Pelagibaca sp.]
MGSRDRSNRCRPRRSRKWNRAGRACRFFEMARRAGLGSAAQGGRRAHRRTAQETERQMAKTRPLTGIRVLELGAYISGPYAAAILASLGAEVVKVEPPHGGDPFRRGVDTKSPYFVQYNAGKKSLAVNLKSPDGLALVKSLLPEFDVVIENSRPGKMAALGLGIEDVQKINPAIVYASVSGFGDGGPWRDRAAYDSIGQSMGAFYSIMNDAEDARLSGTCIGDLITAITATMGILAGLVGRGLTPGGAGADVRTSLLEAMSTITIDAVTQMYEDGGKAPTRESRHPQAQNFCLQTSDGGGITLHLSSSQKFWQALTRAIERPELAEDARFVTYFDRLKNYFELRPIVEAEFKRRDRAEWEARLIEFDVPFAPVLTAAELVSHPQTEWLDMMEPERNGLALVRAPWRFAGERPGRDFEAPHIGEHTREIAARVLGSADVDRLIAEGVLVQSPDGAEAVAAQA